VKFKGKRSFHNDQTRVRVVEHRLDCIHCESSFLDMDKPNTAKATMKSAERGSLCAHLFIITDETIWQRREKTGR
jgi:hypothetical protein